MSQTQVERLFIKDKPHIMAETWRIHTSLVASNGDNFITANLERADATHDAQLNAGMTESSGVFTFPKTGMYRVTLDLYLYSDSQGSSNYIGGVIHVTTDNSSYNYASLGYCEVTANGDHEHIHIQQNVDVTNTGLVKVKFNVQPENNITVTGHSSQNRTHMTFTYLGDT